MSNADRELRKVKALEKIGTELERLVNVQKESSIVMLGGIILPEVENEADEIHAVELTDSLRERMDKI